MEAASRYPPGGMSERGRTGRPAGRGGALATDDVRRQLKGRAEVLEEACERYRMLDAARSWNTVERILAAWP